MDSTSLAYPHEDRVLLHKVHLFNRHLSSHGSFASFMPLLSHTSRLAKQSNNRVLQDSTVQRGIDK